MSHAGFLAAIAAAGDDDGPRLAYADWLDEHGDPERGEFIRVQCVLARESDGRGDLPAADVARAAARERELLARNKDRWLRPLRDLGASGTTRGEFWRGLVSDVTVDAAAFVERGGGLWDVSPVETLRITNVGRLGRRLARCPHLARVRRLELGGDPPPTPTALRALLGSEYLSHLESLGLTGVPYADEDVPALAAGRALPALKRFSLERTGLTGVSLPVFLTRFPRLESLRLYLNLAFRGSAFAGVLGVIDPDRLRNLCCYHIPLGADGVRALAAGRFTRMTGLWLCGCDLDAAAAEALAGATHSAGVATLDLRSNPLREAGAAALASWPGLRAVRTLDLDHCQIGPAGARGLAGSAHLGVLDTLRLSDNAVGDAGAGALAAAEGLGALRILGLRSNAVTAAGARALAASPHLARLRHLDLTSNAVGDEGAEAVADSPHLRSLRWLMLGDNDISRPVARRLIAALPVLTTLMADGEYLTAEHLAAVRDGMAAGGPEADVDAAAGDRLVQAMLDNPGDSGARKLYATFLRDTGYPWWVAVSLQTEGSDGGMSEAIAERLRESFDAHRDEWLAPLFPWARLFDDAESFDRGFLRRVHFERRLPDAVAEALARFPPLAMLPREVQDGVMTGEGAFQVLARRTWLARATRLAFRAVTAAELGHVLASKHLTALEELAVGPCGLGDDAAAVLAASAPAGLRSLDFGWRPDDPPCGGEAANRVGPAGIAALGRAGFDGLRSLGLCGNRSVGDAGVVALLAAPRLRGLAALDLRSAGLTATGVRELAASRRSAALRSLRLGGDDRLGDDAVAVLAESPHLAGLRELDVSGPALPAGDAGAHTLAASGPLAGLAVLRVAHWGGLTDAGVAALRARFGAGLVVDDGERA